MIQVFRLQFREDLLANAQHLVDVDDIDLAILRALRDDPDLSNRALADKLHIAESTCAYRVRALRQRGVIRPAALQFDNVALGRPLQAVIKVRLGAHNKAGVTELFDALTATKGVLRVYHVAGEDDFLVHVAVHDAEALRDIVLEQITVHAGVRSTETHLVFELRDGVGVVP